jgi:hypothetical protein
MQAEGEPPCGPEGPRLMRAKGEPGGPALCEPKASQPGRPQADPTCEPEGRASLRAYWRSPVVGEDGTAHSRRGIRPAR